MDKIKYSLFDLFSYLFPGLLLTTLFLLLHLADYSITDFKLTLNSFFKEMDTYSFIYLLGIGYCVGFCIQVVGTWAFQLIQYIKPLKAIQPVNYPTINNSVKHCLIRHKSPANFLYIETWYVCSSFAINMAVVVSCAGVVLLFTAPDFQWYLQFPISMLIAITFMILSKKFNDWAIADLDNTYKMVITGSITN